MLKKVTITFLTRGIGSFGTLLLVYILGNQLGAEGLGVFMLALSVLVGLSMIFRFGSDLALIKHCGAAYIDRNYGDFKRFLLYSFRLVAALSIIGSISLYFFSDYLSLWLTTQSDITPIIKLFIIIVPAFSFIIIYSTIFKSILKPEVAPFFEVGFINFIFSILIFIVFTFFENEIDLHSIALIYIWLVLLFLLVANLVLLYMDKEILLHKANKHNDARSFYSSLPNMFLPGFMHYLIQWGSLVVLGITASSIEVGQYSVGLRISYMVNFILVVLNTVTAPHFASLYKKGNIKELEKLATKSTSYMIIFGFPVFLVLLIFANDILALAGSEFSDTKDILIILIFGQLINVSTGSVSFLLNMTGNEKEMRNIMVFTGIFGITLCYILSTFLGPVGAAIATSLTLILQNILATWKVYKILHIRTIPGWEKLSKRFN